MRRPAVISLDYNRGLPAPIRWAHALLARGGVPLIAILAAAALLPFDGLIHRWAASLRLGGDIRRELEALQQYGQLTFSLLGAVIIATLDPARRARLLEWGLAALATGVVVTGLKMLLGRPRPSMGEPSTFLGPIGGRPMGPGEGVVLPVEFWRDGVERLWSMPSSHTAYAVVMSVFLFTLYPRLRWVAAGLALFVGLARVVFGAHYPSDVVVGACAGFLVTRWVVSTRHGLGEIGPTPANNQAQGGRP